MALIGMSGQIHPFLHSQLTNPGESNKNSTTSCSRASFFSGIDMTMMIYSFTMNAGTEGKRISEDTI